MFIFFNWAEVQKWFEGDGGAGSSNNCSWDANNNYCWTGKCGTKTFKSCAPCSKSAADCKDRNTMCSTIRAYFLQQHPTSTCGTQPNPTPVPTCKPVIHNNNGCTYDCKGGWCWKGTFVGCNPPGYNCKQYTAKNCIKSNTNPTTGCAQARQAFCSAHSPNGDCTGKCPAGQAPGPAGRCVAVGPACSGCYTKNNQGNCVLNYGPSQAWFARTAVAMMSRMCGQCPVATITQVVTGWPSITLQLAKDGGCSTNRIRTSYAPFNRNFAKLILAVTGAYRIPITGTAAAALVSTRDTGVWKLGPWQGGVPSFLGVAEPRADTPYGFAYSTTLEPNGENAYNPYGDQRYSKTVDVNTMRVKVSN